MYLNNLESEVLTFNEPKLIFDRDLIVGLGFENEKLDNIYAATFFKESSEGMFTKIRCDDLQEDTMSKLVELDSFVYVSQPRSVWFYNKEQHDFFIKLTRELLMHFVWSTKEFYYFDEYSQKHKLNASLVNPADQAKNQVFDMVNVVTRKMKKP